MRRSETLLLKLPNISLERQHRDVGIRGKMLYWFSSYLSNRSQPSMDRFLDSSHLTVAYLRVLVWDPCCSSFKHPRCLRLLSVISRKFIVSRTIRSCNSVSEMMTITHKMKHCVLWRSAYVPYGNR